LQAFEYCIVLPLIRTSQKCHRQCPTAKFRLCLPCILVAIRILDC
jgi:hypothetical protein